MEHLKNDSSGTDDDLPNQCRVQTRNGVLFSRTLRISSKPTYCGRDSNMDYQIHCIETDAYGAVLRAFSAQSEGLSWEKEALITELRKELRVSDKEHREILGKISLDGSINSIREWRKATSGHQMSARNITSSLPCKRLKFRQASEAFPPSCPSRAQPSLNHVRDGYWNSSTAVFSPQMHVRLPTVATPQNGLVHTSGKAKGSVALQTLKKDARSGFGSGNMIIGSDVIEIRSTDKLIKEVEKICGGINPDKGQVDKARLILREHEKALMDAIGKLDAASDGDYPPDFRQEQRYYSNEEWQGIRDIASKQFDSGQINCVDDFIAGHPERAGVPCIDLPDDDFDHGR